ncbi:MAG: hypothetical protein ACREQL_11680 [Candidatus Binatia bacterium]
MLTKRSRRNTGTTKAKTLLTRPEAPVLRVLERRVKRLAAQLAAERVRHVRQLEAVRRAANRRLSAMVQEIAALRHHEARAEALARMLAERQPAARDTIDGQDPRLPG